MKKIEEKMVFLFQHDFKEFLSGSSQLAMFIRSHQRNFLTEVFQNAIWVVH